MLLPRARRIANSNKPARQKKIVDVGLAYAMDEFPAASKGDCHQEQLAALIDLYMLIFPFVLASEATGNASAFSVN